MFSKPFFAVVLGLLLIGGGYFLYQNQMKKTPSMYLFYSESCPHCAIVEEYIESNQVRERLTFKELEVSRDTGNAQKLAEKSAACGIKEDEIGVPLFWDGQKCLIGDQEIIDFLKNKLNL